MPSTPCELSFSDQSPLSGLETIPPLHRSDWAAYLLLSPPPALGWNHQAFVVAWLTAQQKQVFKWEVHQQNNYFPPISRCTFQGIEVVFLYCCLGCPSYLAHLNGIGWLSKMPTVRNARSLVTSRELPSGLQIWGKRPLNALFSVATMNADIDSASEESLKVIQERVAHGTLYVRLTCPTMDNHHNKPS